MKSTKQPLVEYAEDSRSPCGERGLKCVSYDYLAGCDGRSPCGERGLKCQQEARQPQTNRRSPCGERGLKCPPLALPGMASRSLPVRGAWIEISATRKP